MDTTDRVEQVVARRLRRTILRQLGYAAPLLLPAIGCSSSPAGEDEAGVTTNASSDSPTDGTMSDAGESGDTGDGIKLDLAPKFDVPSSPPECWSETYWDAMDIPAEFAGCRLGPFDPSIALIYQQYCVAKPAGGECADICVDGWCEGMDDCVYTNPLQVCGVFEINGECCALVAAEQPPPVGRPFIVEGRARLAADHEPKLDALARHWLELARGEHASIAAFARFVATLQRFAAPARLLADALAAAHDEARHTRAALSLASRFAGRELELGPLEIAGAFTDTDDLAQAVHAAVVEGCIGETLAAHEAGCLAARASDPQVAEVLHRIAADEARHAALAWRFVAWALEAQPQLRSTIVAAFEAAGPPEVVALGSGPASGMREFGFPSPDERAAQRAIGLRELVSPCATGLLG